MNSDLIYKVLDAISAPLYLNFFHLLDRHLGLNVRLEQSGFIELFLVQKGGSVVSFILLLV